MADALNPKESGRAGGAINWTQRRPFEINSSTSWPFIVLISLVLISTTLALYWVSHSGQTAGQHHHNSPDACPIGGENRAAKLGTLASEMAQTRVASFESMTMVRMVAFVTFDTGEQLPLKLRNVTLAEGPKGDRGKMELILATSCAKLTLNLVTDSKQLIVASIDLSTVKVGNHGRDCEVPATSIKVLDTARTRYSCDRAASYACQMGHFDGHTAHMKTVAQLDLRELEIELNGDENKLRSNQFSKAPSGC